MTALEPFAFNGQPVRVVNGDDGEPWFIASDVAKILGYRDAFNMVRRLDPEDRGTRSASTPTDSDMTVISEPGLYVAILGSQVDGAREFKRWVTREILPTIRKSGSYVVPAQRPAIPQSYTEAVRELLVSLEAADEARQKQLAAEVHAAELAPRAALADTIIDATGTWSVSEVAKIFHKDPTIDTGPVKLFRSLKGELKWLTQQGQPMQRYLDQGLMEAKPQSYRHPNSGELVKAESQVRITGKGLHRLHQLLGGSVPVEELLEAEGPVDAQGSFL